MLDHDWQWFKALIEGVSGSNESPPDQKVIQGVFCAEDATINETLQRLHSKLNQDPRVQTLIDTYLPCGFLALWKLPHTLPLSYYRLIPCDAPQVANLPDLGNTIRRCIQCAKLQNNTRNSWLEEVIVALFRAQTKKSQFIKNYHPDLASLAVVLNLVLALLLGLYPQALRRPTWEARVNIYARIHTLLTSDPQKQFAFMVENWVLVQMAICEYLCHIPQIYMPVEAEYIDKWLQLSSKSAQIMNKKTDTFRSEQIDSGNEAWSQWTKALIQANDAIVRGVRNKEAHTHKGRAKGKAPLDATSTTQMILDEHRITMYPVHTRVQEKIVSEYGIFFSHSDAHIHNFLAVDFLPPSITAMQEKSWAALRQKCEWRSSLLRTKTLCLECVLMSTEPELRVSIPSTSLEGGRIVSYELTCTHHDKRSIVNVDMIGKVLRCGSKRYIWAPCCQAVKQYEGDSDTLWNVSQDGTHRGNCTHSRAKKPKRNGKLASCFMCDAHTGLVSIPNLLDHHRCKNVDVHACPRHAPTHEMLQEATNFEQLRGMVARIKSQRRGKLHAV